MTELRGENPVDTMSRKYMYLALTLGYNELAKLGRTMGEKAVFRLLRDMATEEYVAEGHQDPYIHEKPAFDVEIGHELPSIRFLDRDVELMRAYVAEHDSNV